MQQGCLQRGIAYSPTDLIVLGMVWVKVEVDVDGHGEISIKVVQLVNEHFPAFGTAIKANVETFGHLIIVRIQDLFLCGGSSHAGVVTTTTVQSPVVEDQ